MFPNHRHARLLPLLLMTLAPWGTSAGRAAARPRALVQTDVASCGLSVDCEVAKEHVAEALVAQGDTVDFLDGAASGADLDGHDCVWDLRAGTPLTAADIDTLLQYLQGGHGVYLGGENILFNPRNQSIRAAVHAFGGGDPYILDAMPAVQPAPTLFPLSTWRRDDPPHPVVDWLSDCRPVRQVVFDGIGIGWFLLPGNGDFLCEPPAASPAVAWGWDRGGEDLTAAPDGRLVAVLDLNWLANAWDYGDNHRFAGGMARWLCGGTDPTVAAQARCAPRTQGFWARQCASSPTGSPPLLVDDWDTLRLETDRFLISLGLPELARVTGSATCAALDAQPASDPCERALEQVTAWYLDTRDGLVTCDCEFDRSAVTAAILDAGLPPPPSGMDASTLAEYLLGLVRDGSCSVAASIASGLNDGSLLLHYDGEGQTTNGTSLGPRSRPLHRPRRTLPGARP